MDLNDRAIWNIIKSAVDHALRAIPSHGRRPVFSDRLIVLMLLWAVWHDRCLSWACDKNHYGDLFRPRRLPSISRFGRRVKFDRVQRILQYVHNQLVTQGVPWCPGMLHYIDGKPLTVSPVSKDPDARRGRCGGGFAKGYKLHALINEHRGVVVWCVTPLNTDEKTIAGELATYLPMEFDGSDTPTTVARHAPFTLGDRNYDSSKLHETFAARGRRLLTPLRGQKFVGANGRHPRTIQAMSPLRREVVAAWEDHPQLAQMVMNRRNNAGGTFSVMCVACGLNHPPAFVRRLPRVRRWTGCKLILYHARLLAQEEKSRVAA